MTKFIAHKAHKYKETAMGWSTRCSKNVREHRRVKEGDTIEIFHPEVGVWKPCTLLQIRSAKSYVICLQSDTVKHLDVNLSASSILYRVVRTQNSQPKPSWHLNDEYRAKCLKIFQRCNDNPQCKVGTLGGIQVSVEDYLRLGCNKWLDDSFIEDFFNTMVTKSTHPSDRRFIIIGSQNRKFAQSEDDAELQRMKNALEAVLLTTWTLFCPRTMFLMCIGFSPLSSYMSNQS